jgi:DNA primase large subunit
MKVAPGDDHGCPFRHWDQGNLQRTMDTVGIAPASQSNIFGFVRQGQYAEACKQYFFATHPDAPDYIQNHPNKYFDMSMKYRKIDTRVGAEKSEAVPSDTQSQATTATTETQATTDTQMTDA